MAPQPVVTEVTTATQAAAATTLIVNVPAGGIPAGTDIFLMTASSGAGTFSTLVDSKGNTWINRFSIGGSFTGRFRIDQCRVTVPLVSGDTITITFSGSNFKTAGLYQVDNLDGFDVGSAGSSSASGTAVSSGAGTPVGPSRFGLFGCGINASSTSIGTFSGNWIQTGLTSLIVGTGTTVMCVAPAYSLAVPSGSNTVTATLGTAQSWAAGFITEEIKQDAAPQPHLIYMRKNR